ncbi:MAG: phage holin family protein [Clostridiales bacterium]|jgi:toxin secretion/phage lysis holin|nr:phage holin family protein [Clostridiales bacterium]
MDTAADDFKMISALLGGVLGWFLGERNPLFYALISFAVLDYISGVMLAVCQKKISSKIGYRGIVKKAMIFILVGLGNVIDNYIIGSGSSIRTMLIMFYLSNEGISIIENAANIGLPLPKKLKDVLMQIDKIEK